jgi:predicted transcriptional regulator
MSTSTLDWTPEPQLVERLMELAQKRGQPLDALLTEAIVTYLNAQKVQEVAPSVLEADPLIGLFAGSPELATQSEAILQQEITQSGWTWK